MKFMTVCGKIFTSDLKKLARNWVAMVIAAGIAILPSLYGWVNILVSWDPYGNTGGVKVAVVNDDAGTAIENMNIDIGAEVESNLHDNNKLGWVFCDTEDEAVELCRTGKVYAAVVVPSDFSEKMVSFLTEDMEKPTMRYYVNEKINAIAPKMTDSGMNTLQNQITSSFAKTIVDKVFEVLNSLGVDFDSHYDKIAMLKGFVSFAEGDLKSVGGRLDNMISNAKDGVIYLDDCKEDADKLAEILDKCVYYSETVGDNAMALSDRLQNVSVNVRDDLVSARDILTDIQTAAADAGSDAAATKTDAAAGILKAENHLDDFISTLESVNKTFGDAADTINNDILSQETRDQVISMNKGLIETAEGLKDTLSELNSLSGAMSYGMTAFDNLSAAFNGLSDGLDKVESVINKAYQNAGAVVKKGYELSAAIENKEPVQAIAAKVRELDALLSDNPIYASLKTVCETILKHIDSDADLTLDSLKLSAQLTRLETRMDASRNSTVSSISAAQTAARAGARASKALYKTLKNLRSAPGNTISSLQSSLDGMISTLNDTSAIIEDAGDADISNFQKDLNRFIGTLKEVSNGLANVSNKVSDSDTVEKLLNDAAKTARKGADLANDLTGQIDNSEMMPKIYEMLNNTKTAASDIASVLLEKSVDIGELKSFVDKLKDKSTIALDDVQSFKDKVEERLSPFYDAAEKLKNVMNAVSMSDVSKLLNMDGSGESDFISAPVKVDSTKLFPMENYGAGLTPFYTTLCLWVGAVLMCALFSTKAHNVPFPVTPRQEYVGKLMFFAFFGVLQGMIAGLGDVVLLNVRMEHPALFVLLSMFYSLVFTTIVYTLVSLFDNVGKALAVVFLVFQIGGTGGTFPIEVTPAFFQMIYKIMPFTYGIMGMRECVGGIVAANLLKDICVLTVYGITFFLIGFFLKSFLARKMAPLSKKLGESNICGH